MSKNIDLKNFYKLHKELEKKYRIQIGVPNSTTVEGFNLALLAKIHNEGLGRQPRRNFLQDSIEKDAKTIYKNTFTSMVEGINKNKITNIPLAIARGIAINAIGSITKGFITGGFGKWKRLKPSTIRAKKGDARILIRTGLLQRSITFAIKKLKSKS